MSAALAPPAIHSRMSSTQMRVPLIHGFPARTAGFETNQVNMRPLISYVNATGYGLNGCPDPTATLHLCNWTIRTLKTRQTYSRSKPLPRLIQYLDALPASGGAQGTVYRSKGKPLNLCQMHVGSIVHRQALRPCQVCNGTKNII